MNTHLQDELAALESRAAEIENEYSQAVAARDEARDALVAGTGTTGKLTSAQNIGAALEAAQTEIGRRIIEKQNEITAANAASTRAAKIADLKATGAELATARAAALEAAHAVAQALEKMPHVAELITAANRAEMRFTSQLSQLHDAPDEVRVLAPRSEIRSEIIGNMSDPIVRADFLSALDFRFQIVQRREAGKHLAERLAA